MTENLNFYHSTSHKCKYDALKLMLGFQIRIRFDPDLFDQIRILQAVMAVRGEIFHARIPIGIRVVANPLDGSEVSDFTSMEALLNGLYSSFEMADF
jgi:hypothetical protein